MKLVQLSLVMYVWLSYHHQYVVFVFSSCCC